MRWTKLFGTYYRGKKTVPWKQFMILGCGQKLFLPESSEILIFAIFLLWKGNFFLLKKGMYQPGPGFEFGLTEK